MQRDLLTVGFRASQGSILANLKGITEEESHRVLGIEGNSINWIAGHILAARDRAQKRFGGQAFLTKEETDLYRTGTSPRTKDRSCVLLGRLIEESLGDTAQEQARQERLREELMSALRPSAETGRDELLEELGRLDKRDADLLIQKIELAELHSAAGEWIVEGAGPISRQLGDVGSGAA
jgi:hypothetical protein